MGCTTSTSRHDVVQTAPTIKRERPETEETHQPEGWHCPDPEILPCGHCVCRTHLKEYEFKHCPLCTGPIANSDQECRRPIQEEEEEAPASPTAAEEATSVAFVTEECPICLEPNTDPEFLVCGHSFCRKHLQGYELQHCPLCRCPVARSHPRQILAQLRLEEALRRSLRPTLPRGNFSDDDNNDNTEDTTRWRGRWNHYEGRSLPPDALNMASETTAARPLRQQSDPLLTFGAFAEGAELARQERQRQRIDAIRNRWTNRGDAAIATETERREQRIDATRSRETNRDAGGRGEPQGGEVAARSDSSGPSDSRCSDSSPSRETKWRGRWGHYY